MIAYDHPLLGVFWTMLWFFLWFAWIILLFRVFGDTFRSRYVGGRGTALWAIVGVPLPFADLKELGVISDAEFAREKAKS